MDNSDNGRRGQKRSIEASRIFLDSVMNGPEESFFDNFRMDKKVFDKLCHLLESKKLLTNTGYIIKIREQVAIFLYTIGHKVRTPAVQIIFGHHGNTIRVHFDNVLHALVNFFMDSFELPAIDVQQEVSTDPRLYPYFKDCVGVVDCVQFPPMIGSENGPKVLVTSSFGLKIHYIVADWERSTPEMLILDFAITRPGYKLEVPEGKYYLVDGKYEHIPGFCAPYPDVPYGTFGRYFPKDKKELFNHRHFLLQSTKNRTFGALKERFPLLTSDHNYPEQKKLNLIVVACALHNFILKESMDDPIFYSYKKGVLHRQESSTSSEHVRIDLESLDSEFEPQELEQSSSLRDSIATDMWDNFIRDYVTSV